MNSQPYFRVLQMCTRFLLAVLWVAVTTVVTALLFFGNFVVAWQAFDLLGFEPEPLWSVPFLGPLANAIGAGDAQISSLYAAVLTGAMATIVISACKFGNDAITLFFDYRQARAAGTPNQAAIIKLQETVLAFGVILLFAAAVARFDVALFSLRLEGLITGITDIQEGITWLPESVSRLGAYLADFASHARWGYVCVIFGVAFATEKAFQRATERWLVLAQTIDAAVSGPAPTPEAVIDAAPFQDPGVAPVGPDTGQPTAVPSDVAPNLGNGPNESVRPAPNGGRPVQPGPVPPVSRPSGPDAATPPFRGPTVRVVCGAGETIELPIQEVERNPRDYVQDGSGRVWFRRPYYDELQGPQSNEAEIREESTNV